MKTTIVSKSPAQAKVAAAGVVSAAPKVPAPPQADNANYEEGESRVNVKVARATSKAALNPKMPGKASPMKAQAIRASKPGVLG